MSDFVDLVARVRHHAAERPDALALAWFDDRPEVVEQHSFADYLARCEALAGALLARGCRPGEPVLLLHPPCLAFFEAFFACLIAGITPVPAYPPDPLGRGPRLAFVRHVCAELGARHALTTARYNTARRLGNVRHMLRRKDGWPDVKWLATDRLSGGAPPPPRRPAPDELAFIQFTSGSTSRPRGVRISHRNVVHQITVNQAQMTPEDRGVVWLPQYHDFGLINAFLCSLGSGAPVWLCSPLDFLKNPAIWPEMMHRVRATHSAAPDFGYAFVTRKTTPEQRAGWDLSSMKVSGSGGEAVRPETVGAFAEAFGPCGFSRDALYSGWGLAEHVVGATGGVIQVIHVDRDPLRRGEALRPVPADHPRAQRIASSGHPFASVELRVVDPECEAVLPEGRIGELWLASDSVALGYVGDAEATRATFDNRLAGEGDRRWLRTGDLGALVDGELYVTGRRKELIIVRGRNVHPHDVESAVRAAALPAVRPGGIAAVGVEIDGAEQLGLVVELRGPHASTDLDALAGRLRAIIADEDLHLARLAIVDKGFVPKTTSGKLRRGHLAALFDGRVAADPRTRFFETWPAPGLEACPAIDLAAVLDDLTSRPAAERGPRVRAALLDWIAALPGAPAGVRATEGDVGLHALGLDSLAIAGLIEGLDRATGRPASRAEMFELTTLDRLVAWVTEAVEDAAEGAADAPDPLAEGVDGPVRATGFQALVHVDQGAAPGAVVLLEVDGPLIPAHSAAALRAVFDRHDLLRARFEERDGALWMRPDEVAHEGPTVLPSAPRRAQVARVDGLLRAPFDPGRGPLLRAIHAPLVGGGALLGLAAHHLLYDAFSIAALLDECVEALGAAAAGDPVEAEPTPSYLAAARAPAPSPQQVAWWRGALAGAPWPVPVPHPDAAAERWMIPAGQIDFDRAETAALRALARDCDTTLDAVVATAWARAMGGQLDIDTVTCAHPVSTRTARTRAVCGPLVEDILLPLPAPAGDPGAADVRRTGALFGEALRHAGVPYPTLAGMLDGPAPPGGCPVFYAYYDWHHLAPQPAVQRLRRGAPVQSGPLTLRPLPIEPVTSPRPFDYFAAAEHGAGRLRCSLRVNRDRVGARVGGAIVERWQTALRALSAVGG